MMIIERELFFSLSSWHCDCSVFNYALLSYERHSLPKWSYLRSLNYTDRAESVSLFWVNYALLTSSFAWIVYRYRAIHRHIFFPSCVAIEPTKIIIPPLSLDATVGQSLVLPCEVSGDSSLSPIFKWFFNGKAIDFNRQEHFEMIGGVCIMREHTWWFNLKENQSQEVWPM